MPYGPAPHSGSVGLGEVKPAGERGCAVRSAAGVHKMHPDQTVRHKRQIASLSESWRSSTFPNTKKIDAKMLVGGSSDFRINLPAAPSRAPVGASGLTAAFVPGYSGVSVVDSHHLPRSPGVKPHRRGPSPASKTNPNVALTSIAAAGGCQGVF